MSRRKLSFFRKFRKEKEDEHICAISNQASTSFLPPLDPDSGYIQRLRRSLKKSTLISESNPQSTEYFRSNAEILRMRKQHVLAETCMVHPFSMFRAFYEMWMTLVLVVIMFYMPADAAFDLYEHPQGDNKKAHDFRPSNLVLNLLCIVDIVMNFFTGYPVKEKRIVVMEPLRIAKHYIFGLYFITDVVSSIPEPLNVSHFTQRIIASFGIFKIFRLPTLFFYTSRSAEFLKLKNTTILIVKNLLITYAVFHWFACSQYMVPQIREFAFGNISNESWVYATSMHKAAFPSAYIRSVYRATGFIFCISFVRRDMKVWEERLLAIFTFLFGKVFVFYFTVVILQQLLNMRTLEVKYFETISQVKSYMSQKHLPMHMQHRLVKFYHYKYNNKYFKETSITSLFSDKLRGEVNLDICSKLVQSVNLLDRLPHKQLEQIVTSLKAEIYLPNDIIIKAGSVGECMYFLASGTVAVWTPSGKEVCHLQDGAYFGEISLVFKDKRRTANIVAIEICEVYKLDRRAFKNCFKANSSMLAALEDVARERLEITQMYEDVHKKLFLEQSSKAR